MTIVSFRICVTVLSIEQFSNYIPFCLVSGSASGTVDCILLEYEDKKIYREKLLPVVTFRQREMGGQVGSAASCYDSSLGSNPDIRHKYKMSDISKGVANILEPAKAKLREIEKKVLFFKCEDL